MGPLLWRKPTSARKGKGSRRGTTHAVRRFVSDIRGQPTAARKLAPPAHAAGAPHPTLPARGRADGVVRSIFRGQARVIESARNVVDGRVEVVDVARVAARDVGVEQVVR